MNKFKIIFLIIFAILLNSCEINQLKSKYSQNENLLLIYKNINQSIYKINFLFDESLEFLLLKFSKKHQDYWLVEDKNKRKELPKYKFLDTEKNPTVSKNGNENNNNNWYRSHGNHTSNRFSELDLINKKNIKDLKIAWTYKTGIKQDIQCNPIVVNGIIYTPVAGNYIVALDGYSGKIIWKSKTFKNTLAKRGLIFWKDEKTKIERLFFSNQRKLISLDAKTGTLDNKFGHNGIVRTGFNLVTPAIYKNQIIIPSFEHTVESYNIFNGKLNWKIKFKEYISKRNGGVKYKNLAGNPWSGTSLDAKRGIFYLTTGNPYYYFDGTRRPGPNKDTNSIIAVDINKKKKLWSFQETSHDLWNLDLASPPILTSIKKDNELIDVVVTPTKSGNTLILDRVTGKPIFEFRLRKVETSQIPGEKTSAYQPDLRLPKPFEKNHFTVKDLRKKFEKKYSKNEYEFGFFKTPKLNKKYIRPNITGGAEWPGGSVDHKNGIMYVTSNNIATEIYLTGLNKEKNKAPKYLSHQKRVLEENLYPINKTPWGSLNAINLNNGNLLWKVPLGNMDTFNNYNQYTGTENFGGTTATRGGITITTGTLDKKIFFHDSANGNLLKEISLPFIGSAPPTTYVSNGEQFIIVHATGGRSLRQGYGKKVEFGDSLVAMKLN
jgi:quinoprotein glucose dehydrogenase